MHKTLRTTEWGAHGVEILNNMTLIHRDYPDYKLIAESCIIHNLLYVDHQFAELRNNRMRTLKHQSHISTQYVPWKAYS